MSDDYEVVGADELRVLTEDVNDLIARGYTPQGSLVVNSEYDPKVEFKYLQPMYRNEN